MAHIAIEDNVTIDGISYEIPNMFLFAGKVKSGKSFALRYMVQEIIKQKKFKFGWVFCKTAFNGSYDWMKPNVTTGYSERVLMKYMGLLKRKREEVGRDMPPNFIIFDDLIGELNPNNQIFNNLITTFRHYNTSIFLATQFIKGNITKPTFREQVRYVFCWPNGGVTNDKNLFDSFASSFFDNARQLKIYFKAITDDQETKKHFAMLIDTSAHHIRQGIKRFQAGKIDEVSLWAETKQQEKQENDEQPTQRQPPHQRQSYQPQQQDDPTRDLSHMNHAQKVQYYKQYLLKSRG